MRRNGAGQKERAPREKTEEGTALQSTKEATEDLGMCEKTNGRRDGGEANTKSKSEEAATALRARRCEVTKDDVIGGVM
jgi:hypothetical protein